MLLPRILRDLYEFTDGEDAEDFGPLFNFWYHANSNAISAALLAHHGLKITVDAPSARVLEALTKKLFLLTDTIVVRSRPEDEDSLENLFLIPKEGGYEPSFLNEVIDQLNELRPSPLTVRGPVPYWTSSDKLLKNGMDCAYAAQMGGGTPNDIIDFFQNDGRSAVEAGQIVYAPFVPPLELELEFARQNADFGAFFDTQPLYADDPWLGSNELATLFRLRFPCLEGLDLDTMEKVKDDHRDEFEAFSRTILKAVEASKACVGNSDFVLETQRIQRDIIDAGLADVQRSVNKIKRSPALQRQGVAIGLTFLAGAAYLGAPPWLWATGIGASAVKLVTDRVTEMETQGELKKSDHYFHWRLANEAQ